MLANQKKEDTKMLYDSLIKFEDCSPLHCHAQLVPLKILHKESGPLRRVGCLFIFQLYNFAPTVIFSFPLYVICGHPYLYWLLSTIDNATDNFFCKDHHKNT
jgi:hypothetical protein